MGNLLRSALGIAAGGAAMLVLERSSSRRGGRGEAASALLARVRPPPIADEAIEARVRRKLGRTATFPHAITVSIEHGCVDLRGPVETHERARIVKAVAAIRGVDSILDLMTEPSPSLASLASLASARAPAPARALAPAPALALPWRSAAHVLAAAGTLVGVAITLLLLTRVATATARRLRAPF